MIGILIITHGTLGESLIHCASHVLNKRPPRLKQLGVTAQDDPALLLQVDARIFGCGERIRTPAEAARDFRPWIIRRLEQGMPLHSMTRHMLGLFHGRPGARLWRRILSEKAPGARGAPAISVFDEALAHVQAQQSSDVTVGA